MFNSKYNVFIPKLFTKINFKFKYLLCVSHLEIQWWL